MSHRRAVTLVEILISLSILTLVAGALGGGTNYLTRRLVRARNAGVARNLAWKKLAEARNSRLVSGHNTGVFGSEYEGYAFSETIEQAKVKDRPVQHLYRYLLHISWPQGYASERISFETFIFQRSADAEKEEQADNEEVYEVDYEATD